MLKRFLLISLLLTSCAYADLFHGEGYVSPENYAVNEADMINDYSYIPPAPRLNIDNLDDMRFNAPDIVEKEIPIGSEETSTKVKKKSKKAKVQDDEAYKKRFVYKVAKWWVDQRYKREEPHHGNLHEIKVQKRIDYEKSLEEKTNQTEDVK